MRWTGRARACPSEVSYQNSTSVPTAMIGVRIAMRRSIVRSSTGSDGSRGGCLQHVPVQGLDAQRDRGDAVGDEVHPENHDRRQGQVQPDQQRADQREDLAQVGRQEEEDHPAQVAVDHPPFLDRVDDRGEVVVGQHHVGGLLGHLRAGPAHRHADVGALESRSVVDAVPGHGDDVPLLLEGFEDLELVRGRNSREDPDRRGPRPPVPACRAGRRPPRSAPCPLP